MADRRKWLPARFPPDETAAQRLREWLGEEGGLDVMGLGLSGADLSHGDFSESWFTDAKLVGAKLVGTDFYRSDLQRANLDGADLTDCSLVRATLDDAILRNTVLDRADLVKASLYGVDASGASCRGTEFMGSVLIYTNFCGADLRDAVFEENSFKVTLNDETRLEGAAGTIFGPAVIVEGQTSCELSGAALERWLRDRGGDLHVIAPRGVTR
ncbi:pentapeptide repeat-containing protein [Streptomyces echinoruber]|nr:pentapeptide repeat-containing protein [Streptomyces echinoruber]